MCMYQTSWGGEGNDSKGQKKQGFVIPFQNITFWIIIIIYYKKIQEVSSTAN